MSFTLALSLLLSLAPWVVPVEGGKGKVFLTRDEALELAFPKCDVERKTLFLTEDQRKEASKLAGKGAEVESRLVYAYVARRDGKLVGRAYFDAHTVRSLREVVMFVVDTDARIARFEVLSFAEPLEYMPRGKWYDQFLGKRLDATLNLKRGIKSVTGATLTATATTRAARRTLALHAVLFPVKKRAE